MKLKAIFILLIAFFIFGFNQSEIAKIDQVNWLSINEVQQKLKSNPKPVLIDLYTDWCYWCKVMDKRTYQNEKVIAYINEHFYAIKLNAETKDTLRWNNQDYTYNPLYKVNQFSMFATGGNLRFPSTIIITTGDDPVSIPGYLRTGDIEPILKYFGEGIYHRMSFPDYSRTFKNIW
jgi:thioredoxin-related protein